jgi:hypothetical protein
VERIYFYKLTADNGGAPCVEDGLLSLAICKPAIRSTARCGDVIFGFAANSLHPDNRLIYIARVTEKSKDGLYFLPDSRGVRTAFIDATENVSSGGHERVTTAPMIRSATWANTRPTGELMFC